MLGWWRRRVERRRIASELYERIVAQARSPAFYRDLGVTDTMEGRYEMIVLHLFLVRQRLRDAGREGQWIGQQVLEQLIGAMDDALRQIGIGDMGVPKRVKRAAAAFAERSRAYAAALAPAGEGAAPARDALETALLAHVYDSRDAVGMGMHVAHADRLAAYVREARATLECLPAAEVLAGRITFPSAPDAPAEA